MAGLNWYECFKLAVFIYIKKIEEILSSINKLICISNVSCQNVILICVISNCYSF